MDIGNPVRRFTAVPTRFPVPDTREPQVEPPQRAAPEKTPEKVPEREKEPA